MSAVELIAEKARLLPEDKLGEVLDFIEFLASRQRRPAGLRSLEGLWQGFDVSEDDISQARKEMWGSFPREDV